MKVNEFFKNFDGYNRVIIHDNFNNKNFEYRNYRQAVIDHGYYTIKSWSVDNDVIILNIQSQF